MQEFYCCAYVCLDVLLRAGTGVKFWQKTFYRKIRLWKANTKLAISLGKIGIDVAGKQYTATPVVYAPNGDISTSSEYTVSYPGKYTVDYVAAVNGKTYKKTYSFQSKLSSFTTANGSVAEYGTQTKKYLAGYLSDPFNKTATDTYDVTKTGIYVNLASNDRFTYNKVLNLEELQDKPFLTFTCLPEEA